MLEKHSMQSRDLQKEKLHTYLPKYNSNNCVIIKLIKQ